MATLEQENAVRAELKPILSELASLKSADLARKDLGPELNFESGVIFFARTLHLFHALDEADLDGVSYQRLVQLRDNARAALERFKRVQNFKLGSYASNPISQRDQFINEIRDNYDQTFEAAAPVIAYTIRKGTDFERLEEEAKATLQRIEDVSNNHETMLQKSRESANQMVEAVRRVVQEIGVSQHAVHFKNEADLNETRAKPWLYATVAIATATVAVGGVILWKYLSGVPNLTPSQSFQVAIPKVFVFSILLSATVWAGRMYRAYQHNAVVNRHRQNALATFEAFVKAAADNETKNAVLLQATQCIFSPQQTGYVPGDPETAMPPVLEIVRNLGKSG